jgi:preprotein translocase subunit SecB
MATTENNNQPERNINVLVQYVKDISFENPNAPASLQPKEGKPNINVSVDVLGRKIAENQYEVELKIGANAKIDEEVLFITEVNYAGVFRLDNIPEQDLQPILLIFCPAILFPFSRRIIADLTRDGGFPPLMLDPIDFGRLYQQKSEQVNS